MSAWPQASPPSAPQILKPRVRALLASCSPGPRVRDDEVLGGDIRGDGVWERVTGRGAGVINTWRGK